MRRAVYLLFAVPVLCIAAFGGADTPPRAKGEAHICATRYPEAALRDRREGSTDLLFTVTENGLVAGVIIAASSGAPELDFTSAACAAKWQYYPATKSGVPVAVAQEANIGWSLGSFRPKSATPKIALPAANCVLSYAGPADRTKATKSTIVRYQLAGGAVTGAVVERTSGVSALDEHAARCVKTWHFEPVMENGAAATGAFAAFFDWRQKSPDENE